MHLDLLIQLRYTVTMDKFRPLVEWRCLGCVFLKVMQQILNAQEMGSGSFVMRIFSFMDEQSSLSKVWKG
jgi:hypothetical protein